MRQRAELHRIARSLRRITSSPCSPPPAPKNWLDSFSKAAAGIQSIALVIGLVVGGWWALETFVFQNPAFSSQGGQDAGSEPKTVKEDLQIRRLGRSGRQYEITLSVSNLNKALLELVWPDRVDVGYFPVAQKSVLHALYLTNLPGKVGIEIPPGDSRQFRYLATFPEDGIYVVEVDLCREFYGRCPTQTYVSIPVDSGENLPGR